MHLTSEKYDYVRYNGKKKKTGKTNSLGFAFNLSKKFKTEDDYLLFLVANNMNFMVENSKPSTFIGDFCTVEGIQVAKDFEDFLVVRSKRVEDDLKKLFREKENLKNFDFVLGKVLNNEVNFYTIILLNNMTNLKKSWAENSVLYEEYELFLRKISSFIGFKKEDLSKMIAKIAKDMI